MSVTTMASRNAVHRQPGWLARLFDYKPFLIVVCLTPAIGLLLVFLTYPLGLGIWLAFTDTTIGRRGVFVGLENFQYLLTDPLWWSAVFYSVFYTGVATFGKFALGFWLALLLNNHFPFKSLLRAIVLLPWLQSIILAEGWRTACWVLGLFVLIISALAMAAFMVVELLREEPLIQLRLLARRNFGMGTLGNFLLGFALYGSSYLLPQYLAVVRFPDSCDRLDQRRLARAVVAHQGGYLAGRDV